MSVVFLAAAAQASPAQSRPVRPHASLRQVLRQEFVGYGTTEQDARTHALEQARDWLAEKGPFDWTPPVDYFLRRNMVRFSEPTDQELKLAGPMKMVKMDLTVNVGQAEEIQLVAREYRMKDRQGVLARVLAGLVALLLVAGGYLRLEEATRGYYTTLLRSAAAFILALVGAGLWLLI
jgi:hypothetical protein